MNILKRLMNVIFVAWIFLEIYGIYYTFYLNRPADDLVEVTLLGLFSIPSINYILFKRITFWNTEEQ